MTNEKPKAKQIILYKTRVKAENRYFMSYLRSRHESGLLDAISDLSANIKSTKREFTAKTFQNTKNDCKSPLEPIWSQSTVRDWTVNHEISLVGCRRRIVGYYPRSVGCYRTEVLKIEGAWPELSKTSKIIAKVLLSTKLCGFEESPFFPDKNRKFC